jgi:abortive infection bacteriophage resistance protein
LETLKGEQTLVGLAACFQVHPNQITEWKKQLLNRAPKIFDTEKKTNKCHYETFIDHFKAKYGDCHDLPPLWMLCEVMSFGKMLTLFNGVFEGLRRVIAQKYGIESKVLQSWLGALNVVRNICAHHGRLWNRELGFKPMIPRENKYPK